MANDMPAQYVQAYKDATDNLIFLKREQAQITYYTWLLLAALYILAGRASPNGRAFLEFGAGAVGVFSVVMLGSLQMGIRRFRKRLRTIYDRYFDPADKKDFSLGASGSDYLFVGLFVLACFAASVFTIYLIETIPTPA